MNEEKYCTDNPFRDDYKITKEDIEKCADGCFDVTELLADILNEKITVMEAREDYIVHSLRCFAQVELVALYGRNALNPVDKKLRVFEVDIQQLKKGD